MAGFQHARRLAPAKDGRVWYFIASNPIGRFLGASQRHPSFFMQWYYALNGQRQGPISQAEFEQFAREGRIKADTLVWRQGMANWLPYGSVAGAQPASSLPPVAAAAAAAQPGVGDDTEVCVVSGKRYPKREMIQYEGKWISAEHRDEFFQRLREGVVIPSGNTVPGPYGYGGFWQRFCARFLDGLILGVCGMITGAVIGGIFGAAGLIKGGDKTMFLMMQGIVQLVGMAIGISYEIYFLRKYDATPGKMALGVKVLRPNGDKLSVGRIVGRYFATILDALTLLIGYIMAAFDSEKRALHDRICDTRVIKVK
jgi:uncharacterized RDD family membrane protein YckC